MEENHLGCDRGRRIRRLWGSRVLLALAMIRGFAAAGQAVEDDPLPPLPPLDPNQEPPADWSAWEGVAKLIGISQADLATTYSHNTDTVRQSSSGHDHTTVFMELTRPGPEEIWTSNSVRWRVTSAQGSGQHLHAAA